MTLKIFNKGQPQQSENGGCSRYLEGSRPEVITYLVPHCVRGEMQGWGGGGSSNHSQIA